MIYCLTDGRADHLGDLKVGQARLHKRSMRIPSERNVMVIRYIAPLILVALTAGINERLFRS